MTSDSSNFPAMVEEDGKRELLPSAGQVGRMVLVSGAPGQVGSGFTLGVMNPCGGCEVVASSRFSRRAVNLRAQTIGRRALA